jgi:hypothetical protein
MPFEQDIDDIIYKYPTWTSKWGIFTIFSIVILMLLLSWIIRYPEVVKADIILTSDSIPTKVVSRSSGQFICFAEHGQYIKEGSVLGLISNTTSYSDIVSLKKNQNDSTILFGNFQLGELQKDFAKWRSSLKEYREFTNLMLYEKKIDALKKQMKNYESLKKERIRVAKLNEEDLNIDVLRYKRDSILHAQKVIADVDLQDSKVKLIAKKLKVANSLGDIENVRIQFQQINNSILDLELEKEAESKRLLENLSTSVEAFNSSVTIWESKYLLKAPIDGNIYLVDPLIKGQFTESGTEVFYLSPTNFGSNVIGKMLIPLENSGKVRVNQNVIIKLYDFPHKEFGTINGRVNKILPFPIQKTYLVELSLPNGLSSSYDKQIEFKNKMQGTGDVVVDNPRLLTRVFYNFKYIFSKKEGETKSK